MRIAIVDLKDMKVVSVYEAEEIKSYGGPWGDPELFGQVEIPDGIVANPLALEPSLNEDDELQITSNNEGARNQKLADLRRMRDMKMREVDIMVNDLAVGDRTDTNAVRDYRQALKDITEDYKYSNDASKGKATLDSYAFDMSDFVWPEKP